MPKCQNAKMPKCQNIKISHSCITHKTYQHIMAPLGHSPINASRQILQPNFDGGANPSGAHFVNPGPQFSSIVGGVSGCSGAGGSAAALAGRAGYNFVKQSGGSQHRRGGYKRSHKRCKCRGSYRCRSNKRRHCKKSGKRRRGMRGGLSAYSPAPFSGANPPYNQYMGNVPVSYNFGIGSSSPLPFNLIGTAPGHRMDIHNNCAPNE